MYNIKKSHQFISSLQYEKNKRKEKNKRGKNKIKNILEGKKLKGNKFFVSVLGVALLCAIHGTTV